MARRKPEHIRLLAIESIPKLGVKATAMALRVSEKTVLNWWRAWQLKGGGAMGPPKANPRRRRAGGPIARRLAREARAKQKKVRMLKFRRGRKNPAQRYANFIPTTEWVEGLVVGDFAPDPFGDMRPVMAIAFRGVNPKGKAYVGVRLRLGPNGTVSMSYLVGERVATVRGGTSGRYVENPLLGILGNPPKGRKLAQRVTELYYIHAEGKHLAYRHPFRAGTEAFCLPDGTILLRHTRGLPLWKDFAGVRE